MAAVLHNLTGVIMQLTGIQAIDRLTLGATPQLNAQLQHDGVSAWLASQLAPGVEPLTLQSKLAEFDTLSLDPVQLFERYWIPPKQRKDPEAKQRFRMQARGLYVQTASARLWRASASPWQLRELLVDFWFNHFNVFAHKGLCNLWTGSFEAQAIRPYVFGRFSDMLLATAKHPAMLFYLDNWMNTTPDSPRARGAMKGLNENYARELMELHTIGLHYTQNDVAGATRLLTGWGLQRTRGFRFDPLRHDFSTQTILGRQFGGDEKAITDFLEFLATHPDTAQHIAFAMAQYFVTDQPPNDLVQHMQSRFLNTRGDLKAVTEAMIEHPEFAKAAARRDKFRTPYRYVLALLRASGRRPVNSRPVIGTLHQLGQPLYGCVTPNGWANTQAEWLSPDALTSRLNFAVALGGGWLPVTQESDDMMMDSNTPASNKPATPRHEPVDLQTVLAALGPRLPPRTIAVAKLAPAHLRAAVLLGSPQMQYC
jgi:uncharacterized protein (DUF1800 family)